MRRIHELQRSRFAPGIEAGVAGMRAGERMGGVCRSEQGSVAKAGVIRWTRRFMWYYLRFYTEAANGASLECIRLVFMRR